MGNDYKFYKERAYIMEQILADITDSIKDPSSSNKYAITPIYLKDKKMVVVQVVNLINNTSVRIVRKTSTVGLKCFDEKGNKKFEFFQQIQSNNKKSERLTSLFVGDESDGLGSDYLLNKVGIYEKSEIDPNENCFKPILVRENYYNENLQFVTTFIDAIRELPSNGHFDSPDDLSDDFPAYIHFEQLPCVSANIHSDDSELVKHMIGTSALDDLAKYNAQINLLKLYHLLNTTEIPSRIKDLTIALKDLIKSLPTLEQKAKLDSSFSFSPDNYLQDLSMENPQSSFPEDR